MAVSFVAAGSLAGTSTSTTLTVASPAGLSGDLLVFIVMHDDYSDGPSLAASSPPVTLTAITDGNPQTLNDQGSGSGPTSDHRGRIWWGVEDQDAGRNYTFGTLGAVEEMRGVCLRFRGQHATPIQPGSVVPYRYAGWGPLVAAEWGSMMVGITYSDQNVGAQSAPSGWDERVDDSATSRAIYAATKSAITYPFPSFEPFVSRAGTGSRGVGFVIAPASSATYTVAGVTHDSDGDVLGSCQVSLFRNRGSGVFEYVSTQTSNASTGAYSFTVPEDSANFMAVAHKSGSPNVFDVTDLNLDPA